MDKATFKKEAREKIDALSEKIEELQRKLEPMTAEAMKETKIAGEKSLAELKELRTLLQNRFDEMQQVAGEKWNVAMKEFDSVSNEIIGKANVKINSLWERLKRLFE